MNVFCLGISHHTASVKLRECLTLEGEMLKQALAVFPARRADYAPLTELAIVSTCSRLEVYAAAPVPVDDSQATNAAFAALLRFIREVFRVQGPHEPFLYRFSGEKVARHLCRVAASLDSMVLGDPQILGQISEAHQQALDQGCTRHVLSSLFRAGIHAGKRVRTETNIGRFPTNMSAVAIRMAEAELGRLLDRQVLVVGTGEIGQQSMEALYENGVGGMFVASRSLERAVYLAESWSASPVSFTQLADTVAQVDFVLSSTTSSQPVIGCAMVEAAMAKRPDRPLILVDLAVPRNIDQDVRNIPSVRLFDLDGIQSFIENSLARRKNEVPRAEEIVNEETAAFGRWLAVIPVVGELHRRAETIRQHEVERALQRLPDLDPEVMAQIEFLSQSLVRKILHEPTSRLRSEADHQTLNTYVGLITDLFGLDGVELAPASRAEPGGEVL